MGLLKKLAIAAVVAAVLARALLYYLAHFTILNGVIPMFTTERHFNSFAELPALGGKVAVVTGANTGLGFSTAKALAGAGATTVLACRTQTLCENAATRIVSEHPRAIVQTRTLDLGSLASVRGFADSLLTGEVAVDKVDMLVLNAGVMASPYTLTVDGLEQQFGVNHVGHAYVPERQPACPLARDLFHCWWGHSASSGSPRPFVRVKLASKEKKPGIARARSSRWLAVVATNGRMFGWVVAADPSLALGSTALPLHAANARTKTVERLQVPRLQAAAPGAQGRGLRQQRHGHRVVEPGSHQLCPSRRGTWHPPRGGVSQQREQLRCLAVRARVHFFYRCGGCCCHCC
jgi:hypothetical protein